MYMRHLYITIYVDILLGGRLSDVICMESVPGAWQFLKSYFSKIPDFLEFIDVTLCKYCTML